jgi:hypothetical protein
LWTKKIYLGQHDNAIQVEFFERFTYMGRRFEKDGPYGRCIMLLAKHVHKNKYWAWKILHDFLFSFPLKMLYDFHGITFTR